MSVHFFPVWVWVHCPFVGFDKRGAVGSGLVLIIGLNRGEGLGDISGLMFFIWSWIHLSPCHFLLFRESLDHLLQGGTFPVTDFFNWLCLCVFFQNFLISVMAFVVASIVDMKSILADCVKYLTMSCYQSDLVFGMYILYVQ